MSRYYKIVIGNETATQPGGQPATNAQGMTFTNQVNGQADPNGVQVEFDISSFAQGGYFGVSTGSRVTIRGVGINLVSQAMNFNGSSIIVSGGMQKGLPLATAAVNQSGVLAQGTILSGYGNWIGVEQSLEFIMYSGDNPPIQGGPSAAAPAATGFFSSGEPIQSAGNTTGTPTPTPANLSFTWLKGSSLSNMITTTLKTALPSYTVNVNISPNLVLTQDEPGFYKTIPQFARFVNQISLDILGASNSNYSGVVCTQTSKNTINFSDNITQTPSTNPPTMLAAQDFMGQPTWLTANTIQFNTVLRADIPLLGYITFPQALSLQTITTPNSQAFARQSSIFQGTWQVVAIRHIGNSRGPNALDWVTTFQAVSTALTSTQASPGNVVG